MNKYIKKLETLLSYKQIENNNSKYKANLYMNIKLINQTRSNKKIEKTQKTRKRKSLKIK